MFRISDSRPSPQLRGNAGVTASLYTGRRRLLCLDISWQPIQILYGEIGGIAAPFHARCTVACKVFAARCGRASSSSSSCLPGQGEMAGQSQRWHVYLPARPTRLSRRETDGETQEVSSLVSQKSPNLDSADCQTHLYFQKASKCHPIRAACRGRRVRRTPSLAFGGCDN